MLTTDRCPVTGGAPTRMSETAFRSVCGKRRDGVWVDPGLGYAPFFSASKRCGECKGKRANWPEELDIIKPEEQTMGTKATKTTKSAGGEEMELQAKLALRENELAQLREYADAAIGALADVLPHEDKGLDDTRSYADLPALSGWAARRIMVDAAQLDTLRDLLKPGEDETLVAAATSNAKAARAWAALMDRARDAGFGELAEGDPVVMAGTYIMAINEVMAERDKLKREQGELSPREKEALETLKTLDEDLDCARATIAELEARIEKLTAKAEPDGRTFDTMKGQVDDAVKDCLFEWALGQIADGKVELKMQILEAA